MPRWDAEAEERLRTAATELFLEHGYENVTVTQIADRAGLTRRTFSRYFADKRDVLFAGSEQLPLLLGEAVVRADPELGPYNTIVAALEAVGAHLEDRVSAHAAQRRQVIAASPELQERGLTKFAEVADALAAALHERGVDTRRAALLADMGVATFRSGFDRWVCDPARADLPSRLREAADELTAAIRGSDIRTQLANDEPLRGSPQKGKTNAC